MSVSKHMGLKIAVTAALCWSLTTVGAGAAQEQMDARLPFGASPGDKVTLSVTVGSSCKPGTAEVGFSTTPSHEFQKDQEDPRTGNELVLLRPKQAPGTKVDVEIVIPDPGTDEPTFYAICLFNEPNEAAFGPPGWIGSYGGYRFGGGNFGSPSPSPTSGNRPPVAKDDSFETEPGKTLKVGSPGLLANDSDPDGDAIVAAVTTRSTTTDATARFRPNGSFEFRAEQPGMVCVEYVARDPKLATSSPALIVISIGAGGDRSAVVDGNRCRVIPPDEDRFRLTLKEGEGALSDDAVSGVAFSPGGGLGALTVSSTGVMPPAIRVPRYARCTVSSCLWGFYGPPYFYCNQTVFRLSFGRSRYGSMTAYGYLRRGKADFVKVRGLYYEDGRLIHTGNWQKKYFPTSFIDASIFFELHQQFGQPDSTYRVAFQAQWWLENVDWWRDRQIAATNGVGPVPFACTAAYGGEF